MESKYNSAAMVEVEQCLRFSVTSPVDPVTMSSLRVPVVHKPEWAGAGIVSSYDIPQSKRYPPHQRHLPSRKHIQSVCQLLFSMGRPCTMCDRIVFHV